MWRHESRLTPVFHIFLFSFPGFRFLFHFQPQFLYQETSFSPLVKGIRLIYSNINYLAKGQSSKDLLESRAQTTRNWREAHFRGAQSCWLLTACGSQALHCRYLTLLSDNTPVRWVSEIPECTPGENALKKPSTKQYRTVPVMFKAPEAVFAGTGFGK